MQKVLSVQKPTSDIVKMMNYVRQECGNDFQNRVPQATQDNIKEFGSGVMNYEPTKNTFVDTLVNVIGRVWIEYHMFTNPLRMLKKGRLEFGDTVEHLFVNIAKAHQFDPAVAETEWMKREIPDVLARFYKRDYRVFYKQTISDDDLRAAFFSWGDLSNFIAGVFNSMYTGAENDEYLTMKELINQYGRNGMFATRVVPEISNADAAKEFLVAVRAMSTNLTFLSCQYNALGVLTQTPRTDQILLITGEADAYVDVMALAAAFNLEYQQFQYRKIVVDHFGNPNDPADPMNDVQAILIDEDFYQCYDALEKFTRDMNGQGLYWNYWAHYWRIMAVSPFNNAVAFVKTAPTVTSVAVDPDTATVAKGAQATFTATVEGTGLVEKLVTWSVTGGASTNTKIDADGILTVGADETAASLTVTATSVAVNTKTGTATVTVPQP